MRDLLLKEIKLSASVLTYWFLLYGLLFFLPGYPILCGVFFVTLGIFQSFQNARETNDILFSALLPIKKRDVVKSKYLFVCLTELIAVLVMGLVTLIRNTVLKDALVYRENALMNANLFALGVAFVMFGLFNSVFIRGFFKTAYRFAKPFVGYIILAFVTLFLAEAAHHFKALKALNAFGTEHLALQLILLFSGALIFILLTVLGYRGSCKSFENIDL